MDAGPARRSSAGFSLAELLVTLAVLGLAAWIVLRVVDRGTRIRGEIAAPSGPEAVLEAALRVLAKDVRAAGAGGLPADEAIRSVADNTWVPGPLSYRLRKGDAVAVRAGTDQLGLRGAIRSPLVPIEPRDLAAGGSIADGARVRPAGVTVRAPASADLGAVRTRLADVSASGKAFFFVRDAAGSWAVARVTSSSGGGSGEGPLDLVLDFTDPDARARNRGGDPDAATRLGALASGGVFDDLVWFVARGPEGRPPDFVPGSDPESLRFPHPELAFAAAAGVGTWDVHAAGEDVEDLQVAWGLAGAPGTTAWRADEPGAAPPRPDELVDSLGRPRLTALRLALVARAGPRLPRSGGGPPPEFAVPLNGRAPGAVGSATPIGWDAVAPRRIRFDREVRDLVVTLSGAARSGS